MELSELIRKNRSYRRYDNKHEIDKRTLLEMIDLARLTPSAANLQPLRFYLANDKTDCEMIFPLLKWAAYLKDWNGPAENERPTAYIVLIADNNISKNCLYDAGIVSQTILLQAAEQGLGGCIFLSVNRDILKNNLKLTEEFEVVSVIALGKPVEEVVLEDMETGIRYWRDNDNVHHVPKRKLTELIIPALSETIMPQTEPVNSK